MTPVREVADGVKAALAAAGVEVGTYTLPNSATVPAVYVGDPPEGTRVQGLEVVIDETPEDVRRVVTFGGAFTLRRWRVLLKDWEEVGLGPALNALGSAYPRAPLPDIVPGTGEFIPTATFYIPDR